MPQYRIRGAHADTGEAANITVTAKDKAEVREIAALQKVLVQEVTRVSSPSGGQGVTRLPDAAPDPFERRPKPPKFRLLVFAEWAMALLGIFGVGGSVLVFGLAIAMAMPDEMLPFEPAKVFFIGCAALGFSDLMRVVRGVAVDVQMTRWASEQLLKRRVSDEIH